MTRKLTLFVLVLAAASLSFAELSKKEARKMQSLVKIGSVSSRPQTGRNGDYELIKIEYSSASYEEFNLGVAEKVWIRIAALITDKSKKNYLVEQKNRYGEVEDTYMDEGYWSLKIEHGDLEKMKVVAYVIEHGIMEGKTFVPFDEKHKKIKSYEELTKETELPFPNETSLGCTRMVTSR